MSGIRPGTTVLIIDDEEDFAHTLAGRAYALYGFTYANGSGQGMGWWNIFTTTTLKKTGPNYYVIGTCP